MKKAGITPAFFINTLKELDLHRRTQTSISAVEEQANYANYAKASDGSNQPQGNSSWFRHDQYLLTDNFYMILAILY
jgi:hypothetical protein